MKVEQFLRQMVQLVPFDNGDYVYSYALTAQQVNYKEWDNDRLGQEEEGGGKWGGEGRGCEGGKKRMRLGGKMDWGSEDNIGLQNAEALPWLVLKERQVKFLFCILLHYS